jgi:hypothetical protein
MFNEQLIENYHRTKREHDEADKALRKDRPSYVEMLRRTGLWNIVEIPDGIDEDRWHTYGEKVT